MTVNREDGGHKRWCWRQSQMPHQATYDVVTTQLQTNLSSRREKDASILSWPTLIGQNKLWIAIVTA
eukprot:scaffold1041_cov93-Skeletonema_dohrnii-CCMP3373.AAC.1